MYRLSCCVRFEAKCPTFQEVKIYNNVTVCPGKVYQYNVTII